MKADHLRKRDDLAARLTEQGMENISVGFSKKNGQMVLVVFLEGGQQADSQIAVPESFAGIEVVVKEIDSIDIGDV